MKHREDVETEKQDKHLTHGDKKENKDTEQNLH